MPEKNTPISTTAPQPEATAEIQETKRLKRTLKKIHKFLDGYKKRRKKIGKYKKKIGLIRIGKLPKIKKFAKGKAWKRRK